MIPWLSVAIGAGCMMIIMLLLWLRQRSTHNAGVVDVAWSLGTGMLGVVFALSASGWPARRFLVATLVALWALRLGEHVFRRVMNQEEDGRYRTLRERWGKRTQAYLFWFFQMQVIWAVLFALPMLIVASNPTPRLTLLDVLGVVIWLVAVIGEAVADRQLARFKSGPANRGLVLQEGLWRYSRHPNYFFEWLHWWAYLAIALSGFWTLGWFAAGGPLLMLLFLTRVTGIPPTEAQSLHSRGEAYRAYQRTTSAFFPWPPRSSAHSEVNSA